MPEVSFCILLCLASLHWAVAMHEEFLDFIETNALYGLGIGYVDAHLLASVRLSPGALLWTRDKRLQQVAERFGLAWRS